jgi:uncharacterized glyoxalase superfamily protein PhnB
MLKELVIELVVKDIYKSIDFYSRYLDFKINMKAPDNDSYTWVELSNNNFKIMMQDFMETKKEMVNFPKELSSSNIILLKYDLNKTKEIYEVTVKEKITLFMDIRNTEYGTTEFGILDPDNNIIIISGESI